MSDIKYNRIDEDLQQKIISNRESHWINPYAFKDEMAVRRNNDIDKANLWRPVFVRDVEKIMHLPYYNRYADKTQVFSFKNNDDITRRAQHVQLVSRIARNIGSVLGLNLDLIEAIALGHDIGHTPFGHAGERFLSELYHNETNRYFNHNVHSARVLDTIFARNFTMQTLDGVLCHNGEFEQQGYKPKYEKSFDDYDTEMELCYTEGKKAIKKLIPSTLEGCVVRICDMIAYLGKDRQDAALAGIIDPDYEFTTKLIGRENAKIINNLTVDIIEHSYGKDYISLSDNAFKDLRMAKKENSEVIYKDKNINNGRDFTINNISKILTNRRYIGNYINKDVVIENGIPAIVPNDGFDKVQEMIAVNKRAPSRHKAVDDYLLTTKLYCGKCKSFMVGESGNARGRRYSYYKCVNTKRNKTCDKKAVKKDWIEDIVIYQVMKFIDDDSLVDLLVNKILSIQGKGSPMLKSLKKQLVQTDTAIENILNAIEQGIITKSTKKRLDEL